MSHTQKKKQKEREKQHKAALTHSHSLLCCQILLEWKPLKDSTQLGLEA